MELKLTKKMKLEDFSSPTKLNPKTSYSLNGLNTLWFPIISLLEEDYKIYNRYYRLGDLTYDVILKELDFYSDYEDGFNVGVKFSKELLTDIVFVLTDVIDKRKRILKM